MSTPSPLTESTMESYIKKHISEERQQYFIGIFKTINIQPRHLHEMNLIPKSRLKSALTRSLSPSNRIELEALVSDEGAKLSHPFRPYPTPELATDYDSLWKKYALDPAYLAAFKASGISFESFTSLNPTDTVNTMIERLKLSLTCDLDFALWAERTQKELNQIKSLGRPKHPGAAERYDNRIKTLTEQLSSVGLATPAPAPKTELTAPVLILSGSASSSSSSKTPLPIPAGPESPVLHKEETMPSAPGGPSTLSSRLTKS